MPRVRVPTVALTALLCFPAGSASAPQEPLVEAAHGDDLAQVSALLADGANPDAMAEDGSTALAWSSVRGNEAIAVRLLDAGASPDLANPLGIPPLALAIENGAAGVAELLLERGADPNATRESGETPLMTAARLGQVRLMEFLLRRGADPNAREKHFGQTALMWAVGNPEAVRLLLDRGASIEPTTRAWDVQYTIYVPTSFTLGKTGIPWNSDGHYQSRQGGHDALFFAVRKQDKESVRMLLDAGADATRRAADGTSALLAALYNWVPPEGAFKPGQGAPARAGSSQHFSPNIELAQLLLDRGASPTAADAAGYTPLHTAALAVAWVARPRDKRSDGVYRTLPALLTLGSPPDPAPFTPDEALEVVGNLLRAGADPNQQTKYPTPGPDGDVRINPSPPGSSALHIAADSGNLELVRLLCDAGADANLVRKDGHTPFSVAVVASNIAIIDELIARGADLQARYDPDDRYPDPIRAISLPRQGQTAVHLAAGNRSTDVIRHLFSKGAPIDWKNEQGETPLDLADHQERLQESLKRQNTDGDPEKLAKVVRPTETTSAIKSLLASVAKGERADSR